MNRKIRVAIVENNLVIGGVQKLVIHQLCTLDRGKFEPYLVTLVQSETEDFYDQVPPDVPIIRLNFSNPTDIKSWFKLCKTLYKIKPDLVKSSMYFSNTAIRVLQPLLGYKAITAEHNTDDGKGRIQKIINRYLHKLSVTTVVDSEMVASHLSEIEKVPRSQYTVIYNGVDIDAVAASKQVLLPQRDELRLSYGVLPEEKLFLTIARLVRQKNHKRMIEAFSILLERQPSAKLMIVGDGGLKPEIDALVSKLGLKGKVILVSATKDIHQFYIMSDITLLSSDNEGFCIAAMEGMAFGAPLVSTRVAGVIEYLEDGVNGFFAEKTPEDLALKMEQMMTLPEDRFIQFQNEAIKTAMEFSLDKYKSNIQTLFTASVYK